MVVDLVRSAGLLETPLVHDHDPVRHVDGLFLVMSDIDKGNSKLLLQTLQFQLHSTPQLQIQGSKRFIQKQYTWIIGKCSGNRHPLLLSTGQLRRFPLLVSLQLYQFQHFFYLFSNICFGYLSYFQAISDIVRHVHMGKKGVILKYGIYVSFIWLQIRHIPALQPYTSAVWLLQACDNAKGGGLAAAG